MPATRALLLLVVLLFSARVSACCMVPLNFPGDVDQAQQQVLVMHRDGHQEMVIRVAPVFKGGGDGPLYMTWVLTVPSMPTGYREATQETLRAGADFHEQMFTLARRQWQARTRFLFSELMPTLSSAGGAPKLAELNVGPTVRVGSYTITPVQAVGSGALEALNTWLRQNGFPTEDPGHMKYFVDNNFTFLCIYVTPPSGKTLGSSAELPPLQVGFDCPEPYYPGKFSSRQGDFSLDLTVVTDKPLEMDALRARIAQLNAYSGGRVELCNLWSVQPLPEQILAAMDGRINANAGRWYVNRLVSRGFNPLGKDGQPAIASWNEDIFFPLGNHTDELPGFWYYGDEDIWFGERFFREHALAFMVLSGITLFSVLFWRSRRNRARNAKPKSPAAG